MSNIQLIADCTITDLELFNTLVPQIIEASNNAGGCTQYDWVVNGNNVLVLENYVDEGAFFAHLEAVGELMGQLMAACTLNALNFVTPVSNDIIHAVSEFPAFFFTPVNTTVITA